MAALSRGCREDGANCSGEGQLGGALFCVASAAKTLQVTSAGSPIWTGTATAMMSDHSSQTAKSVCLIGSKDILQAAIAGKQIENGNIRGFVRKWRTRHEATRTNRKPLFAGKSRVLPCRLIPARRTTAKSAHGIGTTHRRFAAPPHQTA